MSVNQSDVQASIRASTGTAYDYNGDWMALFDQAGIALGPFDGRMLAWINLQLGASYAALPDAQQAYATSFGVPSWSSLNTVGVANNATTLRALVLAGGVTALAPLVAIGDSHTDVTTSAQYIWARLQNVRNQVGEGLEGVASGAIVPLGNNGQTLSNYLAGGGTNTFTAAMAQNPSVVVACWLTNDVRLGGLGLTVSAVRAAAAALLGQLITNIKAAKPLALIVLRIPTPYLTINVASNNYITDGSAVNPPGLADIYTQGVRLAHYDAWAANKTNVTIFDPQLRVFGTTSPTSTTTTLPSPYFTGAWFADQIHQAQIGYEAEGDDFANWVNAPQPYSAASTAAARVSAPYAPWSSYSRSVEDTTTFLQIGNGPAVTVTSGNTFLDIGPASAPYVLDPTLFQIGDLIQIVAAATTFPIPQLSTFSSSASNSRISLGSSVTVPATAVARTKVRIWRQTQSGDVDVNTQLNGTAQFKLIGRILGGGTTFMDIYASSLSASKASANASTWAPLMQSGDKIYVEGRGSTPITVTSNFAASGNNLRVTGLAGFDWSTLKDRIVVITGNHA